MSKSKYTVSSFLKRYSNNLIAEPEPWIQENVAKKLKSHITTVIDFGCANGRNFIPFKDNSLDFIGFDIHPADSLIKITDFIYNECSIQDFTQNPKNFPINWSDSLVMSHGSLMYIPDSSSQNNLIYTLKKEGCKNFVFHEYTRSGLLSTNAKGSGLGYLDLNKENLKLFTPPHGQISNFRGGTAEANIDISAFISLEK